VKPFDYLHGESVRTAAPLLDDATVAYAGGTDLLPRMKLGLAAPERLVDLKRSDLSDEIEARADRLDIGALTTLAAIERSPVIAARAPALATAAALAATPQIRNRATIAGNLLQRPRCWYYRDPTIDCWLKGGNDCPARHGRNEHHAVFPEMSTCVAVHPSDLAACLVALDATVEIATGTSNRTVPVAELFAAPTEERRTETLLTLGEVITAISVPAAGDVRSTYRKAMDRKAWAFALVGVAAAARFDAGRCIDARVVLAGVANVPRRADAAEHILSGRELDRDVIDAAARAVVDGADPLGENRYKLDLAISLTRDAITELAGQSLSSTMIS
jgi:xanthine dehydrogenase YagS FAD-binding subunit